MRASLEGMELDERIHMLSSFLRMVALLVGEVADAVDHVMTAEGRGDDDYVHVEADDEGLMQRFLVKGSSAGGQQSEGERRDDPASSSSSRMKERNETDHGLLAALFGDSSVTPSRWNFARWCRRLSSQQQDRRKSEQGNSENG